MARHCAICGKVSMGSHNPQSSGMNRVRTHRRCEPNLHRLQIEHNGKLVNELVCTRCRRTIVKKSA